MLSPRVTRPVFEPAMVLVVEVIHVFTVLISVFKGNVLMLSMYDACGMYPCRPNSFLMSRLTPRAGLSSLKNDVTLTR